MIVVARFAGILAAASCATWLIAAPCLAHIDLESPTPRAPGKPDSNLGERPCGQRRNARTADKLNEFRPGESIDVLVDVYVQHPSYFRFAFDQDGDDSFSARPSAPSDPMSDDPTTLPAGEGEQILAYVLDPTGDLERIEQALTLPNVQCDNCTLQLTQFIYGLPLADATYYQCADIVLAGPLASPELGAGGAEARGVDGEGGGCSLSPGARSRSPLHEVLGALVLSVAGWASLGRRRSSPCA
jgi:hypothetical protein